MNLLPNRFALFLALYLAFLLPLSARDDGELHSDYTIRFVTFSVPEAEAVREAAATAPQQDQELFRHFAEMAQSGSAEVASDVITKSGPGDWKVQALAETPYPTEFAVKRGSIPVAPSSFQFRNLGITVSGSIHPANKEKPAVCSFSWERVRDGGRRSFPVFSQKTSLTLNQPVFFDDTIEGRITIVNSEWRLAGMTRPLTGEETKCPARTLLTFIQILDGTKTTPESSLSPEKRMHLFVFRLPVAEAIEWALKKDRNDRVFLEELLNRAARGEVLMDGHAACLFGSGETSRSRSLQDYVYATSFSPDPSAFTFRSLGSTFILNPFAEKDEPDGVHISWEMADNSVRELPVASEPGLWCPEISSERMEVTVPPGPAGTRLTAMTMLSGDEERGMVHLIFTQVTGPSPEAPIAAGQTELQAICVSLSQADATHLSSGGRTASWNDLTPLIAAGKARIIAWQLIAGMPGATGHVENVIETPEAREAVAFPGSGGLVIAEQRSFTNCGQTLKIRVPGTNSRTFDGSFRLSLNRPQWPTVQMLREAVKKDGSLPAQVTHEVVYPPTEEVPLLPAGGPQVVFVHPCDVPADNPEHGRWHAVVLFVRR